MFRINSTWKSGNSLWLSCCTVKLGLVCFLCHSKTLFPIKFPQQCSPSSCQQYNRKFSFWVSPCLKITTRTLKFVYMYIGSNYCTWICVGNSDILEWKSHERPCSKLFTLGSFLFLVYYSEKHDCVFNIFCPWH